MKRIVMLLVFVLLLAGCNNQGASKPKAEVDIKNEKEKVYYNAYANIDESEIEFASSNAELSFSRSDPKVMEERSTHVALVTIQSIDGADNINENTDEAVYPYTYGKMKISRVIRGDLLENEEVEFLRMGAILPYEKYFAALRPAQKTKRLADGNNHLPYIKVMFQDDIDIEVGKSYLVYLLQDDNLVSRKCAYSIIGFEGGLRELNVNLDEKGAGDELKVYNNFTGKWDSLDDLLNLN